MTDELKPGPMMLLRKLIETKREYVNAAEMYAQLKYVGDEHAYRTHFEMEALLGELLLQIDRLEGAIASVVRGEHE